MIDIAAVGSVEDINCWSSIPYFFFEAGLKEGLFTHPWNLELSKFNQSRKYWNLFNLLSLNRLGGYQFSKAFLDKAEGLIPPQYFANTIITFNQSFPRAETVRKAGGNIIYYIDMTLTDLFNDPSYHVKIGSQMKKLAIQQEVENYQLAHKVVTMGRWPLEALHTTYQLPASKLCSILPGANFNLNTEWQFPDFVVGAGISREFVLGFVGKDWERKGLGVIIAVKRELQLRGFKVKVKIIGSCHPDWQQEDGVEFLGFISKVSDTAKFISEIASCDIGCLFSKGEALGISVLEFIAVGVPVAGFYYQGMKDTLLPGASLPFPIDASITEIADKFHQYILDMDYQIGLKACAVELSSSVKWKNCIDNWKPILSKFL